MHDLRAILKTGMVKERYIGGESGRRRVGVTLFPAGGSGSEQ